MKGRRREKGLRRMLVGVGEEIVGVGESFLPDGRQSLKAQVGLSEQSAPKTDLNCCYTILSRQSLVT